MTLVAIVLNAFVALLYVILGPVILPRIMRQASSRGATLAARAALTVFAVFCALTHAEIAVHAYGGFLTPREMLVHTLLAAPQVAGGYAFLMAALFYHGEVSPWKS